MIDLLPGNYKTLCESMKNLPSGFSLLLEIYVMFKQLPELYTENVCCLWTVEETNSQSKVWCLTALNQALGYS